MTGRQLAALVTLPLALALLAAADPAPGTPPAGPLSPKEELATFRVPKGFRVELVAAEPQVVDPVAMAFDEDGRIFVAEMRGYPNGGIAEGHITSGQIRLLEDRDGDGVYETATVFADGLRFPTAVMPWKGGLLVGNAPDVLFLEDTDGDGKADRTRRLYTGFGLQNIQQLINSLQWGLDNWVYGVAGSNGGTITSPDAPAMRPVPLGGRGVRFHPEAPGTSSVEGKRWASGPLARRSVRSTRHASNGLMRWTLQAAPWSGMSSVTADTASDGLRRR